MPEEISARPFADWLVQQRKGGLRLEHVDLGAHADRPRRRKGTVRIQDAASFARLVTDLGPDLGTTRIYADLTDLSVTAVLNDHDGTVGATAEYVAGWGDHRLVLPVHRTREWAAWLERDGKLGDQVEFAHHIEARLADIADPPAGELLELVTTFEAVVNAEFKSGARLQDGTRQLTWVETIDARAGQQGQMEIPDGFLLSVAPFEGADRVQVTARLRFRVRNGALAIGYELHEAAQVERDAFDSVLRAISDGTSIEPYRASAPKG